ncbi:MAG TPA: type ISP restriction/modification enzyme [Verrucomicrobiae bacterium]|jgi:hypothetical protein
MDPLEIYLNDLAMLGGATRETSGYPALANLLNAAGHLLKPKVRCVIHPQNAGAGIPDGGLFTPDQLKNYDDADDFGDIVPGRGAIEVKSLGDDIDKFVDSEQVKKYLARYGQILLTNYREFLLVRRSGGKTEKLEGFVLAKTEREFRAAAAHPRKTTAELGERLMEYLKRVMLNNAQLNNPRDAAFFMASYARDARVRVEAAKDLPALSAVRTALEEALGMKFEADKGEHFFRSTLVQTLFYGVFSAWVLWHKENPARKSDFDWRAAAWTLHVPMIKALFEQVATPTRLGPLGLVEVLDWTAAALNRVDRAAFFEKFLESYAVQYFYEPFLEAFDPELRKQLGVWYTPPEIVRYQVARVDAALREELDIPDGLADPRVFVLDPCCGTGAYLVEVLRRIEKTLKEEKGEGALAEFTIKEAAQKRVFGFEIMPAPFVVAHLQMGLFLQNLAVPLDDKKNERAGIFLTNALTGWDFAGENPKLANWPELEAERKGAGTVKQDKPILVILGNPPYNGYAGVSPEEEQGLVEPYKTGLVKDWGIKKFNLDDLYVRFFRIAERRIAEKTGKGIVCFISNYSYLGDPSFVVMRQQFLQEFDSLWFDCLNGDSRETGKLTPEGKPDPSVFSTEYNREGIRIGTAVCLMIRQPKRSKKPQVHFRQFWGKEKRAEILASLMAKDFAGQYEKIETAKDIRFSFLPSTISKEFLHWPRLIDLSQTFPFNGPIERRGNSLIVFEKDKLSQIADYLDPKIADEEIKAITPAFMTSSGEFDAKKARAGLKGKVNFRPQAIVRYPFKPFDMRFAYLDAKIQPLFSRPSPDLLQQSFKGNKFFITRDTADKDIEGSPFYLSPLVCDYDFISGHARHFPIRLCATTKTQSDKKDDGNGEFGSIMHEAAPVYGKNKITANLSSSVRDYLGGFGFKNPDEDEEIATLVWMHALAIGYSPAYLTENADGIRQDWPRIPLPKSREALLASAELGKQVAALLDTEEQVTGVTAGKIRPELKVIAILSSTKNLSLTAGWGHAGKEGVTMPGKGKLVTKILDVGPDYKLPWFEFHDVYLNESTCWKDIPAEVWDYTIGGYQVIKKWLSYREHELLGRALTPDEAREVTHMARRIAALILLQPELDKNYQTVKSATVPLTRP